MSDPQNSGPNGPDADVPLSPEAKAILKKARRSFAISIGILLLGFIAIGFALVYRVMRDSPPPEVAASISTPAGAEVISAVVADGTVNVTYRIGGVVTLALFDQKTGELTRTVVIGAAAP
ncbi:DUF6476 family protein [Devosia sp.]|uniref:DUF6476 family protein n=1 Tax=Devosia sp. TaxID=1871048 RepID=UPI002621B421|nr:DUF6476 family protein [Devosia sp.]